MDAVTYPDSKVMDYIQSHLIPLRVSSDAVPIADEFNVKWTPCLVTLGPDGSEHHRTVGWLPPEEFIPSMMLGAAKIYFDNGEFEKALHELEGVSEDFPDSGSAPEAIYLKGVCLYKSKHDAKPLKEAYEKLRKAYPDSEWTKRAMPYRLL